MITEERRSGKLKVRVVFVATVLLRNFHTLNLKAKILGKDMDVSK